MKLGVIKYEQRALEDYLMAIYRLEELMGIAKTTYLARELGVTPATVTKMLVKLARAGYVVWQPYRGAKLSDRGRAIAEAIIRKHRIAECFFHNVLGFDELQSHVYAHMLEHLPEEVFERLYDFLGRPSTCPHGNPIPGATPPKEILEAKTIDSFPARFRVRIVRILCVPAYEILERILSLGITLGEEVCIEENSEDKLVVKVRDRTIELGYPLARALRGIIVGSC